MTVPASPGLGFAFALQAEKGTAITNHAAFTRMRVLTSNVGIQQGYDEFPPEVGGGYHPEGFYKRFAAGGGQVRMQSRTGPSMGYLLYALLGEAVSAGSIAGAGAYTTTFRPGAYCSHPWMTVRSLIPSDCDGGGYEGSVLSDSKISSMIFNIGAGRQAITDLTLLSIGANASSNPSLWPSLMSSAFESQDEIVLASSSAMPIFKAVTDLNLGSGVAADFSVPTLAIRFGISNQLSGDGIEPELVVGSHNLDNLILLGQRAEFLITYKWKNAELYKAMMRYGHATDWSSRIVQPEVVLEFKSPKTTGGVNHGVKFTLKNVALSSPEGIVLSGGQYLTMNIAGVATIQATPQEYMTAEVTNSKQYTDLGVSYS